MLHQGEGGAFDDLRVLMHPGLRGLLRYMGAETGPGFQPVVAVVPVRATALDVEMMGVIADLVLGRLRRDRGRGRR